MARIITICNRRPFSFTATTTTTIATNIDVGQEREGTLLVRLHANGLGTGSSATINVKIVMPSKDDPSVEFVFGTVVATAGIAVADPVGLLARGVFTGNFGAFIKVELLGTKGSGACDFTISIELVMKD